MELAAQLAHSLSQLTTLQEVHSVTSLVVEAIISTGTEPANLHVPVLMSRDQAKERTGVTSPAHPVNIYIKMEHVSEVVTLRSRLQRTHRWNIVISLVWVPNTISGTEAVWQLVLLHWLNTVSQQMKRPVTIHAKVLNGWILMEVVWHHVQLPTIKELRPQNNIVITCVKVRSIFIGIALV
jgi:hypothetical protein